MPWPEHLGVSGAQRWRRGIGAQSPGLPPLQGQLGSLQGLGVSGGHRLLLSPAGPGRAGLGNACARFSGPAGCSDPSSGLCWRRAAQGEQGWEGTAAPHPPPQQAAGGRRKAAVGPGQGRRGAVGPGGDTHPQTLTSSNLCPLCPGHPWTPQHRSLVSAPRPRCRPGRSYGGTAGAGPSALSSSSSSFSSPPQSSSGL